MQIDPTQFGKLAPVGPERVTSAEVTGPAEAKAPEGVQPADQLAFSQQASEVQAAHAALAATPEVRAELVARLKEQVQAGTYRVDPDKIADKLISG